MEKGLMLHINSFYEFRTDLLTEATCGVSTIFKLEDWDQLSYAEICYLWNIYINDLDINVDRFVRTSADYTKIPGVANCEDCQGMQWDRDQL